MQFPINDVHNQSIASLAAHWKWLPVINQGNSNGGSTGGPQPPRNFLGPFVGPHFSRRVQNFEFQIYCLLKILANEKDVQGMNMILLDRYCTLTLPNVALAFFVSFGFAYKQQLIILFSISLSFCLLSFIFALSFLQLFHV